MGLDIKQFDGEVDSKFICKVCHKVFLNPVGNACGHLFCSSCITKRLKSQTAKYCPVCEAPLENELLQPSMDFRLELLGLNIRCSNKCGQVFPLADLPDHVSELCPYTGVVCPNKQKGCKKKVRRCDVRQHVEECDFREVVCEACSHVTVYFNLFTHQSKTRCLEKKLKQQVIREFRNNQNEVKRHRAHLNKLHVRREIEDRKVIMDHVRSLQNGKMTKVKRQPGSPESIIQSVDSDIFLTELADGEHGADADNENPSPAPHPSRAGHATFTCMRCNKAFNAITNHASACSWHAGTCYACGKVDYQPGCMEGPHHC